MRTQRAMIAASMLVAVAMAMASDATPVWPPPQSMTLQGAAIGILPDFTFKLHPQTRVMDTTGRLSRACDRFNKMVAHKMTNTASKSLSSVELVVKSSDDFLGIRTDYDYSVSLAAGYNTATAKANTIYGAMYAMETMMQLIESDALRESITITDGPQYGWRGLMIDSGRRFFPVPLVENLLDTMAGVKLNVLHLHASDMCRFGVESKLYPNLTNALTGIKAGFYTQDDIKSLISYASDRGIRVVPEFDFPGHSRGYIPVESAGVTFCEPTSASRDQLFGNNGTYKVVHDLMKEMSELFTDEVFNIGCDETSAKGQCTVESTYAVERRLFEAIATEFNKTPEGWEEAYFDAGAATNNTIVNAWARHTAAEITATGRRAVESKDSAFYFTGAAPGGPAGWSKCWYDIATNVPSNQLPLLLGGEMSMWSDTYCYIDQCGSAGGGAPVGHQLFDPTLDQEFSESIGGMIWPRGFVGAAAFWQYNSTADPSSPTFTEAIYGVNDKLKARGSYVCPTNCSCDQLTACGQPYIKPSPPKTGTSVGLAACALPATEAGHANQEFVMQANGTIMLQGTGLCLTSAGSETYPLMLGDCNAGAVWKHDSSSGEIILTSTGECMDADHTQHSVGTWKCGPEKNQPNQHWSIDSETSVITSLDSVDGIGGECLTANSSTV